MHIVVDAVGARHSGGARVLCDVVKALVESDRFVQVTVLASPAPTREFSFPDASQLRIIDCSSASGAVGRLLWARGGLCRVIKRLAPDVFLGMNGLCPTGLSCATAVFVQQSLPLSGESVKLYGLKGRLRARALFQVTARGVRAADEVYVQTQAMKDAVADHYSAPARKVWVFTPGPPAFPDHSEESGASVAMSRSRGLFRVLYVGNQSPYKNLRVLRQAAALLPPEEVRFFATISAHEDDLGDRLLTSLGRLRIEELLPVYRQADALVMPSFTETVGLPLLEAMQAGVPVIVADRPYAHDVCGDAALFFDPHNPEDLVREVKRLADNPDLRARLVAAGSRLIAKRNDARPYVAMAARLATLAERNNETDPTEPR